MKMLQKKIWLVVILTLILLCYSVPALAAEALPQPGSSQYGFTVVERVPQKLIDAESVLFEHTQTGAQVLYIAADDINRAFDISFRTAALDKTGLPHVFEHICISGSEKYPAQNLFFPLATSTYNTFVNAMTRANNTTYPLASLSEEQLFALSDYYLDGVFHPLIYQEERFFKREAWRYELADTTAPLTLTGTVYNEMRGNEVIDWQWQFNLYDALYPGSHLANNYGGEPAYIPDMTYQSLLDYHQTYYHPSNALVILYGDLQYSKFLALLDGYFSAYEKKEIIVPDGRVAPQTKMVEKTYSFPVEKNSATDKASVINYAFVTNGASAKDKVGLMFLGEILNHDASPLIAALNEALPTASTAVYFDTGAVDPYMMFYAQGVNERDKKSLQTAVDSALREMSRGIDSSLIEAVLASEQFSTYTIAEISDLGVSLASSIANNWATDGNLYYYNDVLDALAEMRKNAGDGYFEGLIRKYLIANRHKALIATVPVAGLAEQNAAALSAKLAAVKASMSEEEIAALIAEGADLAAWSAEEAPKELLKKLQVVSAKSLPEEVKRYPMQDTVKDGVRYLISEATVGEIGYTSLELDVSGVAMEDLHYLNLYTYLAGSFSTEKYDQQELFTLTTQYLDSLWIGVSPVKNEKTGAYTPYLEASWHSLNDDYAQTLELLQQILFKTNLNDVEGIKNAVSRIRLSRRNTINNYPYSTMLIRAFAIDQPDYTYYNYLTGLDYYQFLVKVEQQLEKDPKAVLERLRAVQQQINNRYGAAVLFAGNQNGVKSFNRHIGSLIGAMDNRPIKAADYSSLPIPSRREAMVVDSSVQYNLLRASLEELNLTYSGKLEPLNLLVYDSYLTPQIRHGIGAYDNLVVFNRQGLTMVSYRDPGIAATYEVYGNIGQFLATTPLTQEDIDGYILRAYAAYAKPQGELSGSMAALFSAFSGTDAALEQQKSMREIKSFTLQDVRDMAAFFDQLAQIGITSTAGGAAIIELNGELFDIIIYPDAAGASRQSAPRAHEESVQDAA